MNANQLKQSLLASAIIIGGFTAIFFLSGFVENKKPPLPENYADEDLAVQVARLKGYALGFEGLLADWYWMRSLQYLGDKILKSPDAKINIDNLQSLNPRLLYPYLDNATTLDPRFMSVYEFGATVLPAINQDEAIKLINKGIADHPNEWRLYQHLGYIYWRTGNFEKASEIYAAGAKLPAAPKFMQMMAARTKTEGGSRATARDIYRQMFSETEDAQIKENAALRLLQLDSFDERDAIDKVLQEFQAKNNRCANNWREIFSLLQKVRLPNGDDLRFDSNSFAPVDPTDAAYVLSNQTDACTLRLDYQNSKVPAN